MTVAGSCTLLQGCILLHTVVLMVVQQLFGRAQDTCLTKHRSLPQTSLSSQVYWSHTLGKVLPCIAGSGRGAKARAQSDGVLQHIGQLPSSRQVSAGAGLAQPELSRGCAP